MKGTPEDALHNMVGKMFAHVPQKLTDMLRKYMANDANIADLPRYAPAYAATLLITAVLDKDPREFIETPWLEFSATDELVSDPFIERIIQFGSMLFMLLRHPALPEIARRMRDRDLRAPAYELSAASFFASAGFIVHARPEIGKRGLDYDFTAQMGDEFIVVEVKEFTSPEFVEKTILNQLKKKSRQVPKTAPAVLVFFYPSSWVAHDHLAHEKVADVCERFMEYSQRFNAIYAMEETIGPKSVFALKGRMLQNLNPRHDSIALAIGMANQHYRNGHLRQDPVGPHRYSSSSAPFFKWARRAIPR